MQLTLNAGSGLNFGTFTAAALGGLNGAQNLNLQNAALQPVALTIGTNGGLYTGSLTDGGAGGSLIKTSGSTFTVRTPSTYTGTTTVNGGQILLDVKGGSVATNTSLLGTGPLILGGGSILQNNRTGTIASLQVFAGVTLNQGASSLFQDTRQSNGKLIIQLGALTANTGGTVDLVPNTGNGGNITTTSTNTASGILGGYATFFGGSEYARAVTSNIAGGATYTNAFSANTQNTDLTANLTATAGATTGSVRFNTAFANPTLTLNGNNIIGSGGILITPTVTTNTPKIVSTASTDTLTSGTNQLYVLQYDPNGALRSARPSPTMPQAQ